MSMAIVTETGMKNLPEKFPGTAGL